MFKILQILGDKLVCDCHLNTFKLLNYIPLRPIEKLTEDYTVLSSRIKGIGIILLLLDLPYEITVFGRFFTTLKIKIALTEIRTYA